MTTLVLDAGALIALDRNDRTLWAILRNAADDAAEVSVPAGAIGQAWRDGARQALLSRALKHCDEVALDGALARASGILCGHSSTADIVDASVAIVGAARARFGDAVILTSDPNDLTHLVGVLNSRTRVVGV